MCDYPSIQSVLSYVVGDFHLMFFDNCLPSVGCGRPSGVGRSTLTSYKTSYGPNVCRIYQLSGFLIIDNNKKNIEYPQKLTFKPILAVSRQNANLTKCKQTKCKKKRQNANWTKCKSPKYKHSKIQYTWCSNRKSMR